MFRTTLQKPIKPQPISFSALICIMGLAVFIPLNGSAAQQTLKTAKNELQKSSRFSLPITHIEQGGQHAKLIDAYGKLPLSFEVNQGQSDSIVKFLSRGDIIYF